MPEFLLKRFENPERQIYCYDIANESIGIKDSKSINTEIGYFSEAVEKSLNQSIEQPFSSLLRYIDKIDFDSSGFVLKRGFVEKTRMFMNALLARDPTVYKEMRNTSVYLQLMDEQSQHDLSVMTAIEEIQKIGLFNEYYPTFTVNKTDIPFVLPLCGFYWFNRNKNINLPISPQIAITMVDKEMLDRLVWNGKIRMYLVAKETEANRLNYFAYHEQKKQGRGIIVSKDIGPLEKMVLPDLI